MGGRDISLKGVSVGGRSLNIPLHPTYVRTCVSKEAREDVTERPQLAMQVFRANNYRQGDLCPSGWAVCVGKVGVLGPDVREGRHYSCTPIPQSLS